MQYFGVLTGLQRMSVQGLCLDRCLARPLFKIECPEFGAMAVCNQTYCPFEVLRSEFAIAEIDGVELFFRKLRGEFQVPRMWREVKQIDNPTKENK